MNVIVLVVQLLLLNLIGVLFLGYTKIWAYTTTVLMLMHVIGRNMIICIDFYGFGSMKSTLSHTY